MRIRSVVTIEEWGYGEARKGEVAFEYDRELPVAVALLLGMTEKGGWEAENKQPDEGKSAETLQIREKVAEKGSDTGLL